MLLSSMFVLAFLPPAYLVWCFLSKIWFDFSTESKNYNWKLSRLFWKLFIRPDKNLEYLLKEVIDTSLSRGFPLMKCSIWRVHPLISSSCNGMICHDPLSGDIFIFQSNTFNFSQDELRILIAHEIGHHIDMRTSSLLISHPFTDRIRKSDLDQEEVAWFIAAYLYSIEAVLIYAKRHSNFIPNRLRNVEICRAYLVYKGVE